MGGMLEEGGQTAIIEEHDKIRFSKFYNRALMPSETRRRAFTRPRAREREKMNKLAQQTDKRPTQKEKLYSAVTMEVVALRSVITELPWALL